MEKIAYNGRYFLGAVKFFDSSKGFGFIASNHCGMPLHSAYKQDFYVNSESFAEEEAKAEGRIVVFQILEQRKGREKAINVRRYTKTSDDDVQLALSYYGNYEKIELNDGRTVNLYCSCSKPRKLVAEKVAGIIQQDKDRSPQTTFKHFDFFIKHYKTGYSLKEKYIFDKDFDKDEKQIWVDFFAIFTDEEWLEILKAYPTACRYVTNNSILEEWVESLEVGKPEEYLSRMEGRIRSSLSQRVERLFPELKDHEAIAKLLPEGPKENYLAKVQKLADEIASGIIEMKTKGGHNQLMLQEILIWVLKHTPNKHEDELKKAKDILAFRGFCASVHSYLHNPLDYLKEFSLSPRNYSEDRAYISAHEYARYKSIELKSDISGYFEGLDDSKRAETIENVRPDITASMEKFFDEGNLKAIVGTFMFFGFLSEDYKKPYLERLFPLVKEKLCGDVQNAINENTGLPILFMDSYHLLTSQFDEETKKLLHDDVLAVMRTANNIELISNCSAGRNKEWLNTEEAHQLAEVVLKEWKYKDFSNFFNNNFNNKYSSTLFFSRTEDLCLLIANYAFNLIKTFSLSDFFDGSPAYPAVSKTLIPFGIELHNRRSAEAENIKFLEHLIKLLPNEKKHPLWQTYINERSNIDLQILYDKGLVESLPPIIIEDVVNEITLDNVLADKERWYTRPILPDGPIKKILTNADDSLFVAIAKRLTTLTLTESDIPLAVLLIELMKINKPKDMKDWEEREWDRVFAQRLKAFRASLPSDSKLAVLLWAVHFLSSGSMALLRDFFHLLPPYVQIRVVKRLFSAIATGKFMQTAASLYELIGGDIHQICFPLEIVFAYLMRREKDPSATFDNNIMLSLLDGREDHPEWIGIRQMITECYGRWQVYELPDNRSNYKRGSFFNGIIKEGQDNKLIVFVPNKMVDEHGNIQNYNNKYYTDIQELIKISYDDSEYQKATIQNGIEYIFNQSYKIDLFSVARAYNLKYNRLNNYVGFEKKENENDVFCECRVADALDNWFGISFYWCGNRPCFRQPIRFMLDSEWERYTILDFMRILHIPTDYINQKGKVIRYGHYIILSAYLKGFAKFYEHLKCRECGKLMKPLHITNFASRAVNQFQCADERCSGHGEIVYLNHCFNKQKCNATIDSRDSKQCPNDQYICSECGACCSTENFRRRISHLQMTGGDISRRLIEFVQYDLGHWEKHEFYCYKCGKPMTNINGHCYCADCRSEYNHQ